MHNIVAFYHSSNLATKEYLSQQLTGMINDFIDLEFEVVDETDDRFTKYVQNTKRFPCIILFKNNKVKNLIQSKVTPDILYNWLVSNLG